MALPSFYLFATFAAGLLFGSFLNVCISRLPAHESIVAPRSRCPKCGHGIRWYDNVPVLSWIVLWARCRDCKARISWRYLAVELAFGVWLAFCTGRVLALGESGGWTDFHPLSSDAESYVFAILGVAILGFLLIGLMVMDWQTLRLPDAFTLSGIAIGFVLTCVEAALLPTGLGDIVLNTTHQLRLSSPGSGNALGNVFLTGTEAMVLERVAAICGAALVLLVFRWGYKALRGQDGLGLGDVKLLAMIAAFLGFYQAMLALFAGVMGAAVYGAVLLARRKAGRNTRLPLGSFLAAGGLFAAMFGAGVIGWYAGVMR